MEDKERRIRELPGYKSHTFDGVRWLIEFVPAPWFDGESATINDERFDSDMAILRRYRLAPQEN